MDEMLEANRRLWDEWTAVHAGENEMYDLEAFKRGGIQIRPWEIEDVGEIAGKDLLHLQCHFGMDTLSWARLGARVTGADFSPAAIDLARRTAEEIGVDARFVLSDLYDLPANLEGDFDVVYTSRGVLGWLRDVPRWAEIAASFVRPGGFLYVHEGHPLSSAMADEDELEPGDPRDHPVFRFPYFESDEPMKLPVQGSYADPGADVAEPFTYEWSHSLGEIVTSVARAGLRIDLLREEPFLSWPRGILVEGEDGEWRLPAGYPATLPLMFTLKASKPG